MKTWREKEKLLITNNFSFLLNILFNLVDKLTSILAHLKSLSVRYFVAGQCLTLSQPTNFKLFQTKSLQTTIQSLMKMVESSEKG